MQVATPDIPTCGAKMINENFKKTHAERVNVLKNDRISTICIHEAGHVVMLELHRVGWKIRLPGMAQLPTGPQMSRSADTIPSTMITDRQAAIDVCFGGYCGEMAFLDDNMVKSGRGEFYVNASQARNDVLRLIQFARINASTVDISALQRDGNAGGVVVAKYFNKYAKTTFDKMIARRKKMLDIAQKFYDLWEETEFKERLIERIEVMTALEM